MLCGRCGGCGKEHAGCGRHGGLHLEKLPGARDGNGPVSPLRSDVRDRAQGELVQLRRLRRIARADLQLEQPSMQLLQPGMIEQPGKLLRARGVSCRGKASLQGTL